MANKKEVKKVTKPFHLPLENAKELFKDIKAYGQNVIVIGLHPVKTSALEDNKSVQEAQKQQLARKGFLVISIGADAQGKELKEGDVVSMPDQSAVVDSITREMIVKDAFPALRKFTAIIFPAHYISHYVIKEDKIEEVEKSVDIDYILDELNAHKKKIEKQND